MISRIQKTKQIGTHPKTTKQPINHMTLGQFYAANVTLHGQVCMLVLLQPLKFHSCWKRKKKGPCPCWRLSSFVSNPAACASLSMDRTEVCRPRLTVTSFHRRRTLQDYPFLSSRTEVSSWTAKKLCDIFLVSASWLSCCVYFPIKRRTYVQRAHQTDAELN